MENVNIRLTSEEALLLHIELRQLVYHILYEFAEPAEHNSDDYADRVISLGAIIAKIEEARRKEGKKWLKQEVSE